jgi:hypothetical protein
MRKGLKERRGRSQKRKHTFPVFSNEQVNKTRVCYAILSMHSTFNDETRHKQAYYAWFKYEKAILCCSCFLCIIHTMERVVTHMYVVNSYHVSK